MAHTHFRGVGETPNLSLRHIDTKNRPLGSCATATPPLLLMFVVGCTLVVGITPQPFRLAVSLAKNSKKKGGETK